MKDFLKKIIKKSERKKRIAASALLVFAALVLGRFAYTTQGVVADVDAPDEVGMAPYEAEAALVEFVEGGEEDNTAAEDTETQVAASEEENVDDNAGEETAYEDDFETDFEEESDVQEYDTAESDSGESDAEESDIEEDYVETEEEVWEGEEEEEEYEIWDGSEAQVLGEDTTAGDTSGTGDSATGDTGTGESGDTGGTTIGGTSGTDDTTTGGTSGTSDSGTTGDTTTAETPAADTQYYAIAEDLTQVSVTYNENVDTENKNIPAGKSLVATLSPSSGYAINTVKVMMAGEVIENVYTASTRTIVIESVSGDVSITAIALPTTDISKASITLDNSTYTYDGTAKTPTPTVVVGSTTLVKDTDYTVSYSGNNIEVGTVTVEITGKGSYSGTAKKDFTITRASKSFSATVAQTSLGVGDTTSITISDDLKRTPHYNSNNTKVLTVDQNGIVTARGTGQTTVLVSMDATDNYLSEAATTVPITVQQSISDAKITLSPTSFTYDGTAKVPSVKVVLGSKTLSAGTDYTVGFTNNINTGTATATITGTGSYTGQAQSNYTIKSASASLSVSLAAASINIGKTTTATATGYAGTLTWSSANRKVATVSGDGTVTGVAAGETEIIATSSAIGNYGKTSASAYIQVKGPISGATMSLSPTSYVYDGTEKRPAVTVKYQGETLKEGEDYEVDYSSNVNAGTGTATARALAGSHFTGQISKSFTITKGKQTITATTDKDKIRVGKTTQISVQGAEGALSYSSSKGSVASVNNSGKIKGKKKGTATITITAQATDQKESASTTVSIRVKKKKKTEDNSTSTKNTTSTNASKKTAKTTVISKYPNAKTAYLYGGKYVTSSERTVTYRKKDSVGTIVDIPNEVSIDDKAYKVTRIGKNAFKDNKKTTSLTVGSNLKHIGEGAFSGASKLRQISLNGGIQTVGDDAFSGIADNATISIKTQSYSEYDKIKNKIRKAGAPEKAQIIQEW